jgi:uncharacterized protein YecE (DUF72 family)
LEIITGCSGWSYTSWQGPFYPDNLENRNWLSYYSNIIDYVEIDSTFYRIPPKYSYFGKSSDNEYKAKRKDKAKQTYISDFMN